MAPITGCVTRCAHYEGANSRDRHRTDHPPLSPGCYLSAFEAAVVATENKGKQNKRMEIALLDGEAQ